MHGTPATALITDLLYLPMRQIAFLFLIVESRRFCLALRGVHSTSDMGRVFGGHDVPLLGNETL